MKTDIEEREKIAVKACKETGKILMDSFGKTITVKNKGDRDLVTDIDRKADEAIVKLIKKRFPEDNILSEESHHPSSGAEFKWIIDPMDGTHNYVHKIEIFGTSVALEFEGKIVVGAIYMPWTDELYTTQKGKGAYCNGERINVSKRKLKEATIVYDSSIRYNKKQMLKGLNGLVDRVFNVRMFGSSARNLTYLAEGKVDAVIEFNDKVWDFAAGLLLTEEARGRTTDFKSKSWDTNTKGYIASNGVIHQSILNIIKNDLKESLLGKKK